MKGNRLFVLALAMAIVVGSAAVGALRAAAQDSSGGCKALGRPAHRPGLRAARQGARAAVAQHGGLGRDRAAIEQKVEAKTNDQIKAQVQQSAAQLQQQNQVLAQQVNEMQPAWKSYMDDFHDKFRLGTVIYADYRFYNNTGFQPQEQENLTNPGPGNNMYNSFDITRAYLNFFFFPTEDWAARVTPDVYKTIGSSNDKVGQTTGFGSNLDGNLGVRLKFANLTYSGLWNTVPTFRGGTVSTRGNPQSLC